MDDGGGDGRRRAAQGRGVAAPSPSLMECTMNRAPTMVRPAANVGRLTEGGQPYQRGGAAKVKGSMGACGML